jgi:hypothetical protein
MHESEFRSKVGLPVITLTRIILICIIQGSTVVILGL